MASKKEMIEESQKAFVNFFSLCRFLLGENAPYEINSVKEGEERYQEARSMADEMGLDWKDMSHEESNALMLNLLADAFLAIQPSEEVKPVLTITFKD